MDNSRFEKPGGEEMSTKINLLPMKPPADELEAKLYQIESVRSTHEEKLLHQVLVHVRLMFNPEAYRSEGQCRIGRTKFHSA